MRAPRRINAVIGCASLLFLGASVARADHVTYSNSRIFSQTNATLTRPSELRVRVFSMQPGQGGIVVDEMLPRTADQVRQRARLVCDVRLNGKLRDSVQHAVNETQVRSRDDQSSIFYDWGIEILSLHGELLDEIFLSRDWINNAFTSSEVDGKPLELSKPLLRWIEGHFPVAACDFHPKSSDLFASRPQVVRTFEEMDANQNGLHSR